MNTQTQKKHIVILGKQWRDKVNGVSYFASRVFIDGERVACIPYQSGYGSQYIEAGKQALLKYGYIEMENDCRPLSELVYDGKITLLVSLQEGCKKSEVKEWGKANA